MTAHYQGELIRAEGIYDLLIIVSKNVYNESGQAIVCPVREGSIPLPTTYVLEGQKKTIICDQLRHLDLDARIVRHVGEISMYDMVEVSNIIESLFDYY